VLGGFFSPPVGKKGVSVLCARQGVTSTLLLVSYKRPPEDSSMIVMPSRRNGRLWSLDSFRILSFKGLGYYWASMKADYAGRRIVNSVFCTKKKNFLHTSILFNISIGDLQKIPLAINRVKQI